MTETQSTTVTMSGKFEPKTPVQLAPPKDDIISLEELSKADGMFSLDRKSVV